MAELLLKTCFKHSDNCSSSLLATVEVKMGVWPRTGLKRGQVTFQSRNPRSFLNYFFLSINASCSNSSEGLKGTSAAYCGLFCIKFCRCGDV